MSILFNGSLYQVLMLKLSSFQPFLFIINFPILLLLWGQSRRRIWREIRRRRGSRALLSTIDNSSSKLSIWLLCVSCRRCIVFTSWIRRLLNDLISNHSQVCWTHHLLSRFSIRFEFFLWWFFSNSRCSTTEACRAYLWFLLLLSNCIWKPSWRGFGDNGWKSHLLAALYYLGLLNDRISDQAWNSCVIWNTSPWAHKFGCIENSIINMFIWHWVVIRKIHSAKIPFYTNRVAVVFKSLGIAYIVNGRLYLPVALVIKGGWTRNLDLKVSFTSWRRFNFTTLTSTSVLGSFKDSTWETTCLTKLITCGSRTIFSILRRLHHI